MFYEMTTSRDTKIEYWQSPDSKEIQMLEFFYKDNELYFIDEEIKELYNFLKMIIENKEE